MSSLVTFGETMLRLSPPPGQRLSRTDSFEVHVGGAESNVAVAAAALDVDSTWLSALPDSSLGERITHALQGEGVDVRVSWTDDGRVGTYYFEHGSSPRGPRVIYDRESTPIRQVTPADLDTDVLQAAEYFFTSGITPALSDTLVSTTTELLEIASDAGVTTAFDCNYRSKLWSTEEAGATLRELFPAIDVLFVAERDLDIVFEMAGNPGDMAVDLAEEYDFETVVVTRSAQGALAVHDQQYDQPAFVTETVDPVGSGDAFAGGFLARRIEGGDVSDALAYGAATAALERTIAGDMATVSREEVEAVIEEGNYPTGTGPRSDDDGSRGGDDGTGGQTGDDRDRGGNGSGGNIAR